MSTIAAGTTSGTALVSTGNTDGTLQLQVNGTTPSITLAANGAIGVGSSPSYGSANQVLQSNGSSAAPSWVAAGSGFSQAQIFTSSGSFTVPASGKFKVTIIGGGGSGACSSSGTVGPGSGAGGGTVIKWFTGATPSATATVTIGAGGTGKSSAGAGNAGGDSTFDLSGFSTLTASGGAGGLGAGGGASAGGSAVNGDINSRGQNGTPNIYANGEGNPQVGFGGSTLLAFGRLEMVNLNSTGVAGIYGAGSCGRFNNNTSGAGGAGICIVEY